MSQLKLFTYIFLIAFNCVWIFSPQSSAVTIPQTQFNCVADSEAPWHECGKAIDGKTSTIWHTQWWPTNKPLPHEIKVDLSTTFNINGFSYLPRQDGSKNGRIKDYAFYVSLNGVNWGTAVSTGTFVNDATEKEIVFPLVTGRYVRLVGLSEVNGNPWTSMAELNVLAQEDYFPNGIIDTPGHNLTIYRGDKLDFRGTGDDPNEDFPLTYLWQFGLGSGITDSTLEDPGVVQFNYPGVYTIGFTVFDSKGYADQTIPTLTVTVLDPPSPIEFSPDLSESSFGPFNLIPHPDVLNPVLTASDVTDVNAKFVADPFIFHENGMWYMFFEVYLKDVIKTQIALATSIDGLNWQYERVVLAEPDITYISYPYVFKYNGKYYMTPETSRAKEVRLYEAQNFPYNWNKVAAIATDRQFVDPSIFRYNNKWWMFVGDTTWKNCYLYYSNDLFGNWVEHPMSPVIAGDASKARPGGRAFVYDKNRIIRIAQKDDQQYGQGVRAFEVDILSENNYAEHEIPESPILSESGSGWNAIGMHTFDPWRKGQEWLCAVDGSNGAWSIGIYTTDNPLALNGKIIEPAENLTIKAGSWVYFSGVESSQDNNPPLTFSWNFGDPLIPDSEIKDPGLIQFHTPGVYKVTFTVTDSLGFSDETPAQIAITVKANVIPQTQFTCNADSAAARYECDKAIDGNIGTIWHTQWQPTSPPPPHEVQVDLGGIYNINGFRYLPRQDGSKNGRIKDYAFYVSLNGVNWGTAVSTGTFVNDATEKEIVFPLVTGRYVRLVGLSEVNGNPWTSMAELNVLESISILPQAQFTCTADSEATGYECDKAIDGNIGTIWHTQWRPTSPPPPHEMQVDLGGIYNINGFRYMPRQDGSKNGRIKDYSFLISLDGVNWTTAASGTFVNDAKEKEIVFATVPGRFVSLLGRSEVNGNPWTSLAEFNVLGSP